MGRLRLSEKVLKQLTQEIKTRRIRTALFATDVAEKQRQEQQVCDHAYIAPKAFK
jgi:hypothetical protein